jgi:hypothetical protein
MSANVLSHRSHSSVKVYQTIPTIRRHISQIRTHHSHRDNLNIHNGSETEIL